MITALRLSVVIVGARATGLYAIIEVRGHMALTVKAGIAPQISRDWEILDVCFGCKADIPVMRDVRNVRTSETVGGYIVANNGPIHPPLAIL